MTTNLTTLEQISYHGSGTTATETLQMTMVRLGRWDDRINDYYYSHMSVHFNVLHFGCNVDVAAARECCTETSCPLHFSWKQHCENVALITIPSESVLVQFLIRICFPILATRHCARMKLQACANHD